jgi:hypothetical protein
MSKLEKFDKFTIVPGDITLKWLCFLKFVSIKEQMFDEYDVDEGETLTNFYFNIKKFANLTIPDLQKTTVIIVDSCYRGYITEQLYRKRINIFSDEIEVKFPEGAPVIFPNYVTYLMHSRVTKHENKIEFRKRERWYNERPAYYNQYLFPEIFELASNIFNESIIFTLFSYLTIDKYF